MHQPDYCYSSFIVYDKLNCLTLNSYFHISNRYDKVNGKFGTIYGACIELHEA